MKKNKSKINKNIQILFLTFIISLCLMSCEGARCAVGTVYDKFTRAPIENVKYRVLETGQENYSDSLGKYSACGKFGALIPKKPNINIEFSKEGYNTVIITNPNNIVYLDDLQFLNTFKKSVEHCGQDNNSELNNYESVFLNEYIENRNDFDFKGKKILFITRSNGGTLSSKKEYFNAVKEWNEKYGDKIRTALVVLSIEEAELYQYDAILLFLVKKGFYSKTKIKF